ncbi:MAG: hypothetical protein ACE5F1_04245 [Planctomycetota bacterium]
MSVTNNTAGEITIRESDGTATTIPAGQTKAIIIGPYTIECGDANPYSLDAEIAPGSSIAFYDFYCWPCVEV